MAWDRTLAAEMAEYARLDAEDAAAGRYRCYDCGSTHLHHHTPSCDMAAPGDHRDLPQVDRTQWWTGVTPQHLL